MARSPRSRPLRWAALLPLALLGCGRGGPEYVYIPAPGFQEVLVVRAELPKSGAVAVNGPVTLHANRLIGPWQRVRRVEVPDSVRCVRATTPPGPEFEIANKLRWQVEPDGRGRFNFPAPPDYELQVRFDQPGRYRVWAVSQSPCRRDLTSDTLEIPVE